MDFSEVLKEHSNLTTTEKGAIAYSTTESKLLDLFSIIGGLRNADENRIINLFDNALTENKTLAMRMLFYARDVRGGLGERKVFRTIVNYLANTTPDIIIPLIPLFEYYGRFDDLYCLIDTKCEDHMWLYIKDVLKKDLDNYDAGGSVSLLSKWLKTADASSPRTRKLGIYTAHKLGLSVYTYKRIVRDLRKYLNITERLMSSNKWEEIEYSNVPSVSMLRHHNAFYKHDTKRFGEYVYDVTTGKEKINSNTLYPYDLVRKYLSINHFDIILNEEDPIVEEQWKMLPNFSDGDHNVLVMCDTSGSMMMDGGQPLYTAISLSIYFAERNIGAYNNLFIEFSSSPNIISIKGNTLREKVKFIANHTIVENTDLEKTFLAVLDLAVENNINQDEMPETIVVISDMEIDIATDTSTYQLFYPKMKKKYEDAGYNIPNIVFWDVSSRHEVFHAKKDMPGVQLASGSSTSTFKNVLSCIGNTPYECMLKTLNDARYNFVEEVLTNNK